jgi:D-serine deaminase-like pyridoxal phosphate-dependent protein
MKGIKVPAIAHQVRQRGAIGVTCAKLSEAEVMVAAGIPDILVANQVVGDAKVTRLVNLRKHADIIVCVDSTENAEALSAAARQKGVTVRVLVEVNIGLNRCGVDPGPMVAALSEKVARLPGLRYVGLMGWEGHLASKAPSEEKAAACVAAVRTLVDNAAACRNRGLPVEIVSCGGTGTYRYVAGVPGVTEIQAGGGILGDVAYRRWGAEPECALTMLTTVISRPTPTRIVVDAGRKAMGAEVAPPQPVPPLDQVGDIRLSAEHGTLELREGRPDIRVGDKLEFIVGYGDTTVALHDELVGVRGDTVEVVWPVAGRGRFR